MHPEGLSGHEPTTASSFFPTPPRLRIFDASSQVAGLSRTFSDPHVELVRKSDAKPIDFPVRMKVCHTKLSAKLSARSGGGTSARAWMDQRFW